MTSGQRGSNSGRGGIRQSPQTPCPRCCYFHHLPTTTTTTMQARQKKRRNKSSFSIFVHVAIEAKANRLISISSLPRERVFVARILAPKMWNEKKIYRHKKFAKRSIGEQAKEKIAKMTLFGRKKNPGSAIFRNSVFFSKIREIFRNRQRKKIASDRKKPRNLFERWKFEKNRQY